MLYTDLYWLTILYFNFCIVMYFCSLPKSTVFCGLYIQRGIYEYYYAIPCAVCCGYVAEPVMCVVCVEAGAKYIFVRSISSMPSSTTDNSCTLQTNATSRNNPQSHKQHTVYRIRGHQLISAVLTRLFVNACSTPIVFVFILVCDTRCDLYFSSVWKRTD